MDKFKDIQVGKIRLNMRYYLGEDQYSDGDIEDEILSIVQNETNYDPIIEKHKRFEVFYHLSKEREMIVNAMDISREASVLEIGSGCGAVTGALAEKGKSVDCIELSKRRSLINAYRHKELSNIRINVGNYEDMVIDKKYDVITLIGVLEYAGFYIHSDNPYVDFLNDVKDKLNNFGTLYIAIENKLGMKYFSGCKEDHLGKEFAGIEGYGEGAGVMTFSYYGLIDLFKTCGFHSYYFYFPYPDYKFPHAIYSEDFLPTAGCFEERSSNYTSSRLQLFDETKAFENLVLEKEFRIFTNSFLISLKK